MTEVECNEKCTRKRRRWLRRLLVIFLALLVVLAAAWTIWLLVARAQYHAAVEDIRQRGEPVTMAELFSTTLSDDQNAAVPLQEAIEAYNDDVVPLIDSLEEKLYDDGWAIDEKAVVFDDLRQQPELRKAYNEQLQAILKADDAMLAKLAEMQQRNVFAWDIKNRDEMLQSTVFFRCRQMAKYLRVRSQIAHDDGDDALALDYIEQIQGLRNAPASGKTLIALLVCISLDKLSTEAMEDIVPSLRIGDEPGMASKKQIQSLIQSLLDDTFYQNLFRQGFFGERIFGISIVEDIIDQKLDPLTAKFFHKAYTTPAWSTLCLPILYSDAARHLETMKQQVYEPYIVHYSDITKGSRTLSDNVFILGEEPPLFQPLSRETLNAWPRLKILYLRQVARRRMVAVALAIRLYEVDHGRWPAKLEDLVPKYVPTIPDDPFLPVGTGKIRYLPSANPPRLYSVGDNSTDEGGDYCSDPKDPASNSDWEKQDHVFFLKDKPASPQAIQFYESKNSVEDSASSSDDE